MAITTVDGVLAGFRPQEVFAKVATPTLVAGRPHSLWYLAGIPGAGAAAANTAGGVNLSSSSALVNGQIRHVDPGSGNSYLARLLGQATVAGQLLLCDRLQQICGNSAGSALSVTSTSAQTITGGALPARDNAASTNGDGVLCALEVAATMGAGAPTSLTLGYTDQSGNTGATATNIDQVVTLSAQGAFYRFGLAAGDTGIRSVQTYTAQASMTSGTISLVLYRVLAALELNAALTPAAVDALTGGFELIPNGAVPFLVFIPAATTASQISGQYKESQG